MLQAVINPLVQQLHRFHAIRHLVTGESAEYLPGTLSQDNQVMRLLS